MTVNAKRVRAKERTPSLIFEKDEFLAWSRRGEPRCAYCGIAESDLAEIGLKSQIGLPIEALGIDRLENARDYELDNIAFCCFACNKVKGNVFTEREMAELEG